MAYQKLDPQLPPRADALDHDAIGPGLYGDETALKLDTGEFIAVSVMPKWLANGAGLAITACARWIDQNGSTHTCAHGQHVEVETTHSFDLGFVAAHGAEALSRDVLMLVLGEDTTIGAWSDELRANASIRKAISCVGEAAAAADAGSLL